MATRNKTTAKPRFKVASDFEERPFPDFASNLTRPEIEREFTRRVVTRMRELGMNQSDVAREAARFHPDGVFGRDLVSNYCRAHGKGKIPQPQNLPILARALRMHPDNLLPPVYPSRRAHVIQEPYGPNSMAQNTDGSTTVKLNMRLPFEIAAEILTLAAKHNLDKME